jgi:hypothetical protein
MRLSTSWFRISVHVDMRREEVVGAGLVKVVVRLCQFVITQITLLLLLFYFVSVNNLPLKYTLLCLKFVVYNLKVFLPLPCL